MAIRRLTREEYEKEFGATPRVSSITPEPAQVEGQTGLKGFATGLLKSAAKTGLGIAKGFQKTFPLIGVGPFGIKGKPTPETEQALEAKTTAEKTGKFVGDVAQFAIPGTKVAKATKALSVIPRIGTRAAVSGAVGTAQTGDIKGGALAAGVEALAPGVGKVAGVVAKPITALMGRLFKGISSSLSGASSGQIEAILANPRTARQAVKGIKATGGASLLRKNANAIVQGVSKIRQDARRAFGEGLDKLSEADINPTTFRDAVGTVLNKFGSVVSKGQRVLQNVEFDDPKNLKRASDLISRLSRVKLDGRSLRKLADDIDATKFKTAISDERLAFNAFTKDLSQGLKDAISKSTNKLDEINKAFSANIQLAEGIQQIFGKVKFKNLKEVLIVSQRMESLFTQRGLAPEVVDSFLQKIGIKAGAFRAGEAARQMGELAPTANTIGISVFEFIRSFTAAVVPPKAVRFLAIWLGIGNEVASEIATRLSPIARAALIRTLMGDSSPDQEPINTTESPNNAKK